MGLAMMDWEFWGFPSPPIPVPPVNPCALFPANVGSGICLGVNALTNLVNLSGKNTTFPTQFPGGNPNSGLPV